MKKKKFQYQENQQQGKMKRKSMERNSERI